VPMQGDLAAQNAILNSTFDQLWMP
jgi:hypothetical protein